MINLTLKQIAEICNDKLGSQVFEVIDDEMINTTNRFEGNDVSLTIEGDEYISKSTGDTTNYGQSDGYVVANDVVEAYKIWTS